MIESHSICTHLLPMLSCMITKNQNSLYSRNIYLKVIPCSIELNPPPPSTMTGIEMMVPPGLRSISNPSRTSDLLWIVEKRSESKFGVGPEEPKNDADIEDDSGGESQPSMLHQPNPIILLSPGGSNLANSCNVNPTCIHQLQRHFQRLADENFSSTIVPTSAICGSSIPFMKNSGAQRKITPAPSAASLSDCMSPTIKVPSLRQLRHYTTPASTVVAYYREAPAHCMAACSIPGFGFLHSLLHLSSRADSTGQGPQLADLPLLGSALLWDRHNEQHGT